MGFLGETAVRKGIQRRVPRLDLPKLAESRSIHLRTLKDLNNARDLIGKPGAASKIITEEAMPSPEEFSRAEDMPTWVSESPGMNGHIHIDSPLIKNNGSKEDPSPTQK